MAQKLEERNQLTKDLEDALKTNIFLEDKLAEQTRENDSLKLALENCRRPLIIKPQEISNNNNSRVTEDRNQDVSSLKTHLEDNIKLLRDQVQELLTQRKTSEGLLTELKEQNKELQNKLSNMNQEFQSTKEAIEREKQRWSLEKEKVMLYQKQLNQNNLQILKRNKDLEAELRSLREGYQMRTLTAEASY
jgi:SMC interacting uncharacterized protein involved in chromosome segregation